ncbi:hypothetical protein KVV02_003221 [Mortierella alpina]|uniref:Uncharacterized protein n=1 Tax=Mortierella alpina TaxID=64518 RepID=A0A9P8D1J2_MORAP|nr:hypothetical protein KVV02_003221 [Mortierella alpina]
MATWMSNYLASLGVGPEFEPYFTGVLYDQTLSEEDKSATIYDCLETNCAMENINLQDAVAELFAQYALGGLFWLEAPLYGYSNTSSDFQYQTPVVASRAIPIMRPSQDELGISGAETETADKRSTGGPETWARIDDDEDPNAEQGRVFANGQPYPDADFRDTLDPFDDDEFNPFAPPSASDLEMLNGSRNAPYGSYHSSTDQQPQYPPAIFYSAEDNYDLEEDVTMDQDMTPLEMLVMIIRDVSPDKIEKAFAKAGYDFDRTLEALMSERFKPADADLLAQLPQPQGDIRSTQTCRHFLQGNCFRKDCWYSHDLDSMVCKFWLKGQCLKGETCEFNHFLDTSRVSEVAPTPVKKQEPPAMDDFDFPSLAASTSTNKSKGSAWGAKTNGQAQKKDSSNNGNASINSSSSNGHGSDTSSNGPVDALVQDLEEKAKVSSPPLTKPPAISYLATAAAAASKPLTPLQRNEEVDVEQQRKNFKFEMAPTFIPWLETGSTLNSAYLQSRAQAVEYARARNHCFELATQAYLRNDGATAAKLSAQGRDYNDLMMTTHREASRQIFNSRNQMMVQTSKKGETWIDLHGLHVDEALAFLDEFMEKLETECYTGTVYVVTGTGNHSTNARAKLKPAVMDWLESWGYVWKEMSIDKVFGGVLAIQVIKGKA